MPLFLFVSAGVVFVFIALVKLDFCLSGGLGFEK